MTALLTRNESKLKNADVFVNDYRPTALEHLGFGPDEVFGMVENRDKGIIYARLNCYGWKGPYSQRAGWAQLSDCLTGIAMETGRFLGREGIPHLVGPNVDYLGGHAGIIAVLQALYLRASHDGSYLTQASLIAGNIQMASYGQYDEATTAALKARNKELLSEGLTFEEYRAKFKSSWV